MTALLLANTESVLLRFGGAAGALIAILTLVNLIFIRPLRKMVQDEIADAKANNGNGVAEAIEAHEVKHHRHQRRQA